jgi:hypothetical protein
VGIGLILALVLIAIILVQAFRPKRWTPPKDASDNWNYDGD